MSTVERLWNHTLQVKRSDGAEFTLTYQEVDEILALKDYYLDWYSPQPFWEDMTNGDNMVQR